MSTPVMAASVAATRATNIAKEVAELVKRQNTSKIARLTTAMNQQAIALELCELDSVGLTVIKTSIS